MSKKRIQPKSITFKLDGPKINAECFTKGVNTFFDLIEDVAYEVGGHKKILEWIVDVKRVCVYGLIKYKKSGIPISVDIEELEIFPPQEMLPTPEDVLGILNN